MNVQILLSQTADGKQTCVEVRSEDRQTVEFVILADAVSVLDGRPRKRNRKKAEGK